MRAKLPWHSNRAEPCGKLFLSSYAHVAAASPASGPPGGNPTALGLFGFSSPLSIASEGLLSGPPHGGEDQAAVPGPWKASGVYQSEGGPEVGEGQGRDLSGKHLGISSGPLSLLQAPFNFEFVDLPKKGKFTAKMARASRI